MGGFRLILGAVVVCLVERALLSPELRALRMRIGLQVLTTGAAAGVTLAPGGPGEPVGHPVSVFA